MPPAAANLDQAVTAKKGVNFVRCRSAHRACGFRVGGDKQARNPDVVAAWLVALLQAVSEPACRRAVKRLIING